MTTKSEDVERSFCNKCGFFGEADDLGHHKRPSDGHPCSYLATLNTRREAIAATADGEPICADCYAEGYGDDPIPALASTKDSDGLVADSGMDGETVKRAEWLWTNLPIRHQTWDSLGTHEKAMVCHAVQRLRSAAIRKGDNA